MKETEDKQTICEQLQGTEKLMLPQAENPVMLIHDRQAAAFVHPFHRAPL
jgi:hypothetical protein